MHSSERGWVDSGLPYVLYPFLGFPLKEIRMLKVGHVTLYPGEILERHVWGSWSKISIEFGTN